MVKRRSKKGTLPLTLRLTCVVACFALVASVVTFLSISKKPSAMIYQKINLAKPYLAPIVQTFEGDDLDSPEEDYEPGDEDENDVEEECKIFPRFHENIYKPTVPTELKHWDFNKRIKCPKITIDKYQKMRQKAILVCDKAKPTLKYTMTNESRDLFSVPWGDNCLEKVIDNCCSDNMAVPNVLHYVWYKEVEFGYFHFLSYMSALRFMKPCLILIHGNYVPFGKYWDYFIRISPNIIHVKRDRILKVHNNTLSYPEHGADVMRIEAVQRYGGLYLDWDQVLLRSINNLRQYDCTMGQVYGNSFGNQVIFGKKNATFLKLWHDGYKEYKTRNWGYNSLFQPYKIAVANPTTIHIEGYNFTRPRAPKVIHNTNYDWSTNYAMHLYIRYWRKASNLTMIRDMNTTMGSVNRHIMFGNKELCSD